MIGKHSRLYEHYEHRLMLLQIVYQKSIKRSIGKWENFWGKFNNLTNTFHPTTHTHNASIERQDFPHLLSNSHHPHIFRNFPQSFLYDVQLYQKYIESSIVGLLFTVSPTHLVTKTTHSPTLLFSISLEYMLLCLLLLQLLSLQYQNLDENISGDTLY